MLHTSSASFEEKNYSAAVTQFASGLDIFAKAIGTDACGLKHVADVITSSVPKLQQAIVKIEASGAVSIAVGSAEVYDTLYQATTDLSEGDSQGFGMQIGILLTRLRA